MLGIQLISGPGVFPQARPITTPTPPPHYGAITELRS